MKVRVALVAPAVLCLAALAAGASDRYGLSPLCPLEVRSAPGDGGVVALLPPHSLYFLVLEEPERHEGWMRIASLPSVAPPYGGWVFGASVELFDTVRAARLRYFESHPLREQVARLAAALQGSYWDLRDQGGEADAPSLWRRYGFDFSDWYVARGKAYESELLDVCDVLAADEGRIVMTLFTPATTTPPERLEIEILGDIRIRVSASGGPALAFGRSLR